MERRLGLTRNVEVVTGIERAVAKVFSRAAVKSVGTALGDDVDHCARIPAIFGLEIRKHIEFGDGINRKNGGRRSEYSCLVDRWVVAVAVIHVGTVEQIVVRAATRTIHTELAVGTWGI